MERLALFHVNIRVALISVQQKPALKSVMSIVVVTIHVIVLLLDNRVQIRSVRVLSGIDSIYQLANTVMSTVSFVQVPFLVVDMFT
jgi:hypothetical protein